MNTQQVNHATQANPHGFNACASELDSEFYCYPARSIRRILDGLVAGQIGWSHALNLTKSLPSPWNTPEWAETRAKRMDCKCGRCGATGKYLVLQHTKHPKKFYDLVNEVSIEMASLYKQKTPAPVELKEESLRAGTWGVHSGEFGILLPWIRQMQSEWRIQIYGIKQLLFCKFRELILECCAYAPNQGFMFR